MAPAHDPEICMFDIRTVLDRRAEPEGTPRGAGLAIQPSAACTHDGVRGGERTPARGADLFGLPMRYGSGLLTDRG